MATQQGYATFTIAAKDAASGVMGKIGNSMGRLKSAAGTAFKALAAGAAAAGAAIAALAIQSIKAAAEDEQSTIRLNAALQARGFAIKELTPLIDQQIKAAQRLGFTDDQVRAALETGSRFFKDRTTLMASLNVAENIAAATGKDLADVQMILGKAVMGQTRGLKTLGIEVKKGATAQDIFTAANAKYAGIAEQLANSTAGKFTAAQIAFNEQIESLGYRLLPAVNEAMGFIANNVLPFTDAAFKSIGDAITAVSMELSKPGGFIDSVVKVGTEIYNSVQPAFKAMLDALGPLLGSVGDLIGALWGNGDGALAFAVKMVGEAFKIAFELAKPFFDAIKWLVDNITAVIKALSATGYSAGTNAGGGSGGNYGMTPITTGGGGTSGYLGGYGSQGVSLQANDVTVNLGRGFVSNLDAALGAKYAPGRPSRVTR